MTISSFPPRALASGRATDASKILAAPSPKFYVGISLAILAVEAIGFGRSARERMAEGGLSAAAMVHATLFSAWIVVFCAQAVLVASRHIQMHRRLGIAATMLGATMIATAPRLAIGLAGRGHGLGDPLEFLFVMLADLALFAAFAIAGIAYRRRPMTHKRLMLLATESLLPPGLGRWPGAATHPAAFVMIPMLLFVVAAPVYDRVSGARVSRVSIWGGVALLASIPVRFAIAHTGAWHQLARWLTR